MLENLGPMEMFLIVIIVVVLFGAKRVPEIAGSFGKGIREFKRAMHGDDQAVDSTRRYSVSEPALTAPAVPAPTADRSDGPKRLIDQIPGRRDETSDHPPPGVS